MSNDKQYRQLICCARWRRIRQLKLSKQPLCERCLEYNRIRPATEVHHLVPVGRGRNLSEKQSLAYDLNNLQALCHDCHIEVHKELGRSGNKQRQAVAHERLQRFKDRFL